MVAPQRARNQISDVIGRAFAIHRDFLADDFAFECDIRLGKCGMPDHVAENIGKNRQLFRFSAGVIDGLVFAGAGIHLATGVFDLKTQCAGIAAGCAFEDHVLQEMRESCRLAMLIAAAGGDVDCQCGALGIRQGGQCQARAIGNSVPMVGCPAHGVGDCAANIAVASARSAGVVILRLGWSDSTNFTLTPSACTADTSSVTARPWVVTCLQAS